MMIRWNCLFLCTAVMTASASAATISTGSASWFVDGTLARIVPTQFNYFPPFSDGSWISNASFVTPSGTYLFTLNIGALVTMPGTFSLSYGADNNVSWSITNGSLAGAVACLNASGDCFGPGSGPTVVPAMLSGTFDTTSVLTAAVVNSAGNANPMALFVVGSANAVPEPLTVVMVTIPIVLLWTWRRSIRPEVSE
jgi:hypothetical protein